MAGTDEQDDSPAAHERKALTDLLQSEGWKVFRAYVDREWGPAGYGWQMQDAIAHIPQGPDRAYELAAVAERVDAIAKAVNNLAVWPQERINELTTPRKAARPFEALRRMTR